MVIVVCGAADRFRDTAFAWNQVRGAAVHGGY